MCFSLSHTQEYLLWDGHWLCVLLNHSCSMISSKMYILKTLGRHQFQIYRSVLWHKVRRHSVCFCHDICWHQCMNDCPLCRAIVLPLYTPGWNLAKECMKAKGKYQFQLWMPADARTPNTWSHRAGMHGPYAKPSLQSCFCMQEVCSFEN